MSQEARKHARRRRAHGHLWGPAAPQPPHRLPSAFLPSQGHLGVQGVPPRLPIQGATTADMEGARDQPFLRDPSGKPRTGCSRRARPPTLSVLGIHKGADVDSRPAWWRDFPQWLLGEGHPSLTSEPQGLRPRPDLTQLPPALVSTETPEILPVSPPRSGWGLLSALARAAVLGLLWPGLQGCWAGRGREGLAAQTLLPRNLGLGRETDAPEVPGPTLTALGAGAEGLVGGRGTWPCGLQAPGPL